VIDMQRNTDRTFPGRLAILTLTLFAATGIALAGSCSGNKMQADLLSTAKSAGSFETLVAAVRAAGLQNALRGDGPLTVFAPTDEAFAKLPAGTLEALLKPENKATLTAILTYHVASGRLTADEVVTLDRIKTLNGQRPAVAVDDHGVRVGPARVTATDIMASNGVIHVIDTVLLPEEKDIVGTALEAGQFNTLAAALEAADLVGALQSEGPFTVFAPTDEAFAKLPAGTVESLLKPENKEQLASILTYHVVAGDLYSSDVRPGSLSTLEGSEIAVSARGGKLMIDQARVIATDIATTNGVIHVIDEVILPAELRAATEGGAQGLIRMAIEAGVPLFNHGQPEACAAIYQVAAQGLLAGQGMGLSAADRRTLELAMAESRTTHDARRQAWIMRHALDDVMGSLRSSERSDGAAMTRRWN
jgi:uncharacterized surface protein with fasciclin (FAS1) repeats